MRIFVSTLALALYYAVAATADPALETRQGTSSLSEVTCGRSVYSKQQVDLAVAEGCRLYAAPSSQRPNNYPHKFNNFEGLTFAAAGPYQEFPILASGSVYSGSEFFPLLSETVIYERCGTNQRLRQRPHPARTASSSTQTTRGSASTSAPLPTPAHLPVTALSRASRTRHRVLLPALLVPVLKSRQRLCRAYHRRQAQPRRRPPPARNPTLPEN